MKRVSRSTSLRFSGAPPAQRAFTLPDVMTAMCILIIALGGSVSSHLFGVRIMEMSNAKAAASAEARKNIYILASEISSAKDLAVGTGNATVFSQAGIDVRQGGAALQIWPSTDTNVFIRYFVDGSSQSLRRMASGAASEVVIANAVKNTEVFTLEDFTSTVLSNNQQNCVVGVLLQFNQVQSPSFAVGAANHYTAYQVQTKIARRAL